MSEGRCATCYWWGGGPYWDHCQCITRDDGVFACIDEDELLHCEEGEARLLVSADFGCVLWEKRDE
jgi:hypothetical protein